MLLLKILRCPNFCIRNVGKLSSKFSTATTMAQDGSFFCDVTDVQKLSSTVLGFTVKVADRNVSFKAGQWVDVFIPDTDTISGYSMCSSPKTLQKTGEMELAVKYSTYPPTLWMHSNCHVGSRLKVRVGGDFFYDSQCGSDDLLLIGGGVGINPLKSILEHFSQLLEDGIIKQDSKAVLLHSAKEMQELLFRDKLDELKAFHPDHISCQYFITDEKIQEDDCIKGRRINEDSIRKALQYLDSNRLHVYLCGPPPMLSDFQNILKNCGIDMKKVHFEKWW